MKILTILLTIAMLIFGCDLGPQGTRVTPSKKITFYDFKKKAVRDTAHSGHRYKNKAEDSVTASGNIEPITTHGPPLTRPYYKHQTKSGGSPYGHTDRHGNPYPYWYMCICPECKVKQKEAHTDFSVGVAVGGQYNSGERTLQKIERRLKSIESILDSLKKGIK
ncbi:MAG TPA: hypothetical protein ENH82_00345 [bacterium]|nr:hypothetical protein [bacterium]